MKNHLNLVENDVPTSDKLIIERLKFQLEQCQMLNSNLEKTVENQKVIIDRQKKSIDNNRLTINFLNDWKFADHRFQTDIRATCKN